MGASERRKGQRGEREVAAILATAGIDCRRARDPGQRQMHGDIYGQVPFYVEVKNHAYLRMSPWLTKLELDRDERPPLLAFKHAGQWWGAMPLTELARVLGARAA